MTLREFTNEFMPLPNAKYGRNNPIWRKVFPTNLRWHTIVDVPDKFEQSLLFGTIKKIEGKSHLELEEQWERIHKGEVIDTEWRKLHTY